MAGRDGSGLRPITSLDSPEVRHPSWSPDGHRIAFEAAMEGNTDVYVIGADGGRPRRLTEDASIDRFPNWSRDGRWIYFSSDRSGRQEIWKTPAEGGPPARITRNGGFEPIESLDGASIYYVDRGKLKQVSVNGGDEKVLLERVEMAHWAVTRKGIFFMTGEREFDAIDIYDPGTGAVRRAGRLPFRVARIGDIGRITVSQDGRWALSLEFDRQESDIMYIDNFR